MSESNILLAGGPLNGETRILDMGLGQYFDPEHPEDLYTRQKVGMAEGTTEVMCHTSISPSDVVDTLLGV